MKTQWNAKETRGKSICSSFCPRKTALSAKVWELKDTGQNYEIKNKIVRKAHPYKTGDSVCDLCGV